jgi:hypothetical protein
MTRAPLLKNWCMSVGAIGLAGRDALGISRSFRKFIDARLKNKS